MSVEKMIWTLGKEGVTCSVPMHGVTKTSGESKGSSTRTDTVGHTHGVLPAATTTSRQNPLPPSHRSHPSNHDRAHKERPQLRGCGPSQGNPPAAMHGGGKAPNGHQNEGTPGVQARDTATHGQRWHPPVDVGPSETLPPQSASSAPYVSSELLGRMPTPDAAAPGRLPLPAEAHATPGSLSSVPLSSGLPGGTPFGSSVAPRRLPSPPSVGPPSEPSSHKAYPSPAGASGVSSDHDAGVPLSRPQPESAARRQRPSLPTNGVAGDSSSVPRSPDVSFLRKGREDSSGVGMAESSFGIEPTAHSWSGNVHTGQHWPGHGPTGHLVSGLVVEAAVHRSMDGFMEEGTDRPWRQEPRIMGGWGGRAYKSTRLGADAGSPLGAVEAQSREIVFVPKSREMVNSKGDKARDAHNWSGYMGQAARPPGTSVSADPSFDSPATPAGEYLRHVGAGEMHGSARGGGVPASAGASSAGDRGNGWVKIQGMADSGPAARSVYSPATTSTSTSATSQLESYISRYQR
eukprot:jgi/Mesvir1/21232/Mv06668-RA.1